MMLDLMKQKFGKLHAESLKENKLWLQKNY